MWGQGLPRQRTFAAQFADYLRAQGRNVEHINYAQSGAIIGTTSEIGASPSGAAAVKKEPWSAEMPSSYPTIRTQIREAYASHPNAKTLLIDGGANDISFLGILSLGRNDPHDPRYDYVFGLLANIFTDSESFDYRRYIQDASDILRERVKTLLEDLTTYYPQSRIIYTGYFAGLSRISNLNNDVSIKNFIFGSYTGFAVGYSAAALSSLPTALFSYFWADDQRIAYIERIKVRAATLYLFINEIIAREIRLSKENSALNIQYVDPHFHQDNAMWARNSYIYQPGMSFDRAIARERCRLYHIYENPTGETLRDIESMIGKGIEDLPDEIVERASSSRAMDIWKAANSHIAHPNQAGADQYSSRVRHCHERDQVVSLRQFGVAIGAVDEPYFSKPIFSVYREKIGKHHGEQVSLRQSYDMAWLDHLSVQFFFSANPYLDRADNHFELEIDIGEGWKPTAKAFTGLGDRQPLSASFSWGRSTLKVLKYIQIKLNGRLTGTEGKFSARVEVFWNGYMIASRSANPPDFTASGPDYVIQVVRPRATAG